MVWCRFKGNKTRTIVASYIAKRGSQAIKGSGQCDGVRQETRRGQKGDAKEAGGGEGDKKETERGHEGGGRRQEGDRKETFRMGKGRASPRECESKRK